MKASETTAMPTDDEIVSAIHVRLTGYDASYDVTSLYESAPRIRALFSRSPVKDAAPEPDEHGETPETYEEIGRTFMEKYREIVELPEFEGYICCDSPVEAIDHLLHKLEDAAPAPVLTEDERKLVEDFKQAQREYPNASFASKWHNGLLAIIDRLTKQAPQPEENV